MVVVVPVLLVLVECLPCPHLTLGLSVALSLEEPRMRPWSVSSGQVSLVGPSETVMAATLAPLLGTLWLAEPKACLLETLWELLMLASQRAVLLAVPKGGRMDVVWATSLLEQSLAQSSERLLGSPWATSLWM